MLGVYRLCLKSPCFTEAVWVMSLARPSSTPLFKLKKYTMVKDSHHGNVCCKPKSQIPNPYPQSTWNLRAIQTSEPLNPKPKSQSVSCLALLRNVSYFSSGRSVAGSFCKETETGHLDAGEDFVRGFQNRVLGPLNSQFLCCILT